MNMLKTEYGRLIEQNQISEEYLQKLQDQKAIDVSSKNLTLRLDHFQHN